MSEQLNKSAVSIAANPIHRFPKNYTHVTTGNFMEFGIATVMEMPKSSLKCTHKSFMRTFPLKRPLLSNINVHKQAYFVPYRCIWEPWSDFRTDTPHNQPEGTGIISNTPLINLYDLMQLFTTSKYSEWDATIPSSDLKHSCDFSWVGNEGDQYHTFTDFGRWAYKLFCSMGLRLPFASGDIIPKDFTIDALPFLAVSKVFLDYFFPNQYAHYGVYATIDGIMQRQITYILTASEIDIILDAMYKVSYASDYFISCFDKPLFAANGTQSLDFEISDVSLTGVPTTLQSHIRMASNGTPVEHRADDSQQYVYNHTQYMDSMMKSLTNYIRRHSLAGSRALTRYLSDWGVVLTADKMKRCYKLGEQTFPLQVGDVMSMADTLYAGHSQQTPQTGAALGDYAGRAVAFDGDFTFDCDTDEDGLLVVTYSIVPSVSYVQGIQRYWFHKTKLDFLTGDFDGLYERTIDRLELFAGTKRPVDVNGIHGFIPAYAEYKIDYDVQSGDFACDTKNLGLMGFESARLFDDEVGLNDYNLSHGLAFVMANDANQFNRIFFDDDGDADKFILIHRAEFNHNIPAVPLWDNYDFEDGKKKIKIDVNGAKDN